MQIGEIKENKQLISILKELRKDCYQEYELSKFLKYNKYLANWPSQEQAVIKYFLDAYYNLEIVLKED